MKKRENYVVYYNHQNPYITSNGRMYFKGRDVENNIISSTRSPLKCIRYGSKQEAIIAADELQALTGLSYFYTTFSEGVYKDLHLVGNEVEYFINPDSMESPVEKLPSIFLPWGGVGFTGLVLFAIYILGNCIFHHYLK